MSSFSSATSAQRKASLRAAGRPSAWSRVMWMSANRCLLQLFVTLFFRERGQLTRRIIKPVPVAADLLEQDLEAGHQFVVGGLRAEESVVGARHPLVIPAP